MIVRIEGRILEKQPTRLVVGVGGVGLEVAVPLPVSQKAGDVGATVSLHTVLVVREDALSLYGFSESAERALFLKLISVSGIGPKIALNALSGLSVEALVVAIRDQDLGQLTRLPGIGRKTAERLCVELKEALTGFEARPGVPARAPERDAMEALISLGYHRPAAQDAVRRAVAEVGTGAEVEDLVKRALAVLGTGKR